MIIQSIFFQVRIYASAVFDRFLELVQAPLQNQEMLWILLPLLLVLILIEFYFGRYVEEELGWNTAFANTLVLLFVSLDLARYLYKSGLLFIHSVKTALVIGIFVTGIFLAIVDFFHLVEKRFAFEISSALPINFTAYITIILVYTNIPLDYITGSAVLLFLIILSILIAILHRLEPKVRLELRVPQPESLEIKKESVES